jgi:hypothetical protein
VFLTERYSLPGIDKRTCPQIVERWRDLSEELKRAVLAVVAVDC